MLVILVMLPPWLASVLVSVFVFKKLPDTQFVMIPAVAVVMVAPTWRRPGFLGGNQQQQQQAPDEEESQQ